MVRAGLLRMKDVRKKIKYRPIVQLLVMDIII